jgi:hypothetical protein
VLQIDVPFPYALILHFNSFNALVPCNLFFFDFDKSKVKIVFAFCCFPIFHSLFCFGNHQKKRPNNLIFGRLFDWQLLDMVEFGVVDYEPMEVGKV